MSKRSYSSLLLIKPKNLMRVSSTKPQQSTVKVVEKTLSLLPPRKGVCQCCAVDHPPHEAHNPQSMYYQFWFLNQYGRSPTWRDAIAHCPDSKKALWEQNLKKVGIDIDSTNLTGDIKSKEDLDNRLSK